jgi:hypothetical protein
MSGPSLLRDFREATMNQLVSAQGILENLTPSHLRVLEVCLKYPKGESGSFCGEWVMHACQDQGIPFHQAWLTKLANVGLLVKEDTSRRGHRRYYHLGDGELVKEVLFLAGAVQIR